MSIFTLYPKIAYKVNEYDYLRAIDITQSTKIKSFLKDYRGISFNPYIVKDGERPDYIAHRFYGDSNLDWVVLLSNEIYNIYDEWPRNSVDFEDYLIEKYGSIATTLSTVQYYYNSTKDIIDVTTYNALSVSQRSSETVYEYELRANNNKSRIKLIRPNIIGAIQSELRSLLYNPVR
jgi:hypothetical protein